MHQQEGAFTLNVMLAYHRAQESGTPFLFQEAFYSRV
jgi:hypothetical protein